MLDLFLGGGEVTTTVDAGDRSRVVSWVFGGGENIAVDKGDDDTAADVDDDDVSEDDDDHDDDDDDDDVDDDDIFLRFGFLSSDAFSFMKDCANLCSAFLFSFFLSWWCRLEAAFLTMLLLLVLAVGSLKVATASKLGGVLLEAVFPALSV